MCCPKNSGARKYRPNYCTKPLTLKFYAKHDNAAMAYDNQKQYEYFANELEKRLKYDRRDRYYAPTTENQNYGWLERSAVKYKGLDQEILVHKMVKDDMMHILQQIAFDKSRLKN